jgi:hypothetical protein
MKRLLPISAVALISFAIGVGLVLFLKRQTVPEGWITIVPDKDAAVLFDAAMKDDIPRPNAGKPESRVKFLQRD